jgi:hypothetical protein
VNGYAKATLWIGLFLILGNLLANGGWASFWSIITAKGTTGGTAKEAPDPSGTKQLQQSAAGANASKNVTLT